MTSLVKIDYYSQESRFQSACSYYDKSSTHGLLDWGALYSRMDDGDMDADFPEILGYYPEYINIAVPVVNKNKKVSLSEYMECDERGANVINLHNYINYDSYAEVKEKITNFLKIKNHEMVEAPSEKTVQDALYFVDNVLKKQGIVCSLIRPVSDGEINFFWDNDSFILDVALYGDDKYYYYFENKSSKNKYSLEQCIEDPFDGAALSLLKAKW